MYLSSDAPMAYKQGKAYCIDKSVCFLCLIRDNSCWANCLSGCNLRKYNARRLKFWSGWYINSLSCLRTLILGLHNNRTQEARLTIGLLLAKYLFAKR
jgi:hypothetical protein